MTLFAGFSTFLSEIDSYPGSTYTCTYARTYGTRVRTYVRTSTYVRGEESSGEQDTIGNEGDGDRSHAQAGLHDGHFGSREEQFMADFEHGVV